MFLADTSFTIMLWKQCDISQWANKRDNNMYSILQLYHKKIVVELLNLKGSQYNDSGIVVSTAHNYRKL